MATKSGTLVPLSDSKTDDIPEAEYDAVFISGKDKIPVGRVRSADAFDSNDLKPGTKLVPQGLKFAFVGNNATAWTVYADTLVTLEKNTSEKPASSDSSNTTNKSVQGTEK